MKVYRFIISTLTFCMAIASTFATADTDLKVAPYTATYSASITKGIQLDGKAIRSLRQNEDGSWLYSFEVDTLPADIKETSLLKFNDSAIQAHEYHYSLSGMFIPDREQHVRFDYENGEIYETYKKKSWTNPSEPGLLDRLNYQLQLQLDVASGERESLYRVMHKGKIREYRFRVIDDETISTKLGDYDATVVEKVRDADKKRETKLWFGKSAPYPLLRMTQLEEDGERYEINIETLDY